MVARVSPGAHGSYSLFVNRYWYAQACGVTTLEQTHAAKCLSDLAVLL